MDFENIYATQDAFTLHEIACLLMGQEPVKYIQGYYRDSPVIYQRLITQLKDAVVKSQLKCLTVSTNRPAPMEDRPTYIDEFGETQKELILLPSETPQDELTGAEYINPEFTKVDREALAHWLEDKKMPGSFSENLRAQASQPLQDQVEQLTSDLEQAELQIRRLQEQNETMAAELARTKQALADEKSVTANQEQQLLQRMESSGQLYADPDSPYYAPKLIATIEAHAHIATCPEATSRRSPKQAIEKFLDENAKRWGLENEEGIMSKNTREACALIGNPDPIGTHSSQKPKKK